LATKYLDDQIEGNAMFSKVGGINLNEMTELENMFLKKIDFKLFISSDDFKNYLNHFQENNRSESDAT
jgi:hypothetical protein